MSKPFNWNCPRCGREFRLSSHRRPPEICKDCTAQEQKLADVHFDEAPTKTKSPKPVAVTPAAAESAAMPDADKTQQEILKKLEEMAGTMKLFRRMVWGMGFALVLNVVLMGAAGIYAISMINSLNSLTVPDGDGAGQVNVDALPENLRGQIKQVEEYSKLLNELANEQ